MLFAVFPGISRAQTEAEKAELKGIVDIHAHSGPDYIARRYDGLKFAQRAKALGFRGAVMKSHEIPTSQMVYFIRQLVPGFEAWGTVVLNRSVGGINPRVVEIQAQVEGHFLKFVFFPTNDAENPAKHAKNLPYVPVSKDGALLPAVYDVMKVIKQYDLVMCTGHVVPADALLLVHAAKDMGLTRVVVTHPALEGTTIPQMQEEVATGAFIELTSNQIIPVNQDGTDKIIPNPPSHQPSEYADIIKNVGEQHIILSGDFGRPDYINFIPGWPMAIAALKKVGVTQAQIDIMAKKNPAHVLGMDDPKPAK
jgi:hypothetical protein